MAPSRIHRQGCACGRCSRIDAGHVAGLGLAPRRSTWATAWLFGCATGCLIVLAIVAAGGPSLCVLIGGAP